jgi:hypothetical protein
MPATTPPLPSPRPDDPPPESKSFLRALVGVLALASSVIVLPAGFVLLISGLQDGNDDTRSMVNALGVLSIGGGLMALGVAMLIWEMSVRYGVRK